MPTYLVRSRHSIFYFRYPLPAPLCPLGQSRDIKLSLQTRDPKRALQTSRLLAYIGDTMTNQAVQKGMSYAEIRSVLHKHFTDCLNTLKARVESTGPQTQFADYYSQMHAMGLNIADELLTSEADTLISKYALPLKDGSGPYELFRSELAKAHKAYCAQALNLLKQVEGYRFDVGEPCQASPIELKPTSYSTVPATNLETVITRFVKERVQGGNWVNKTEREYSAMFTFLMETLGADTDIKTLSVVNARTVKEALGQRDKPNARRGFAPRKGSASRTDSPDTLSVKTINKHLTAYAALFRWAVANGYADANIFQGLSIRQAKSVEDKRKAFSHDQIASIVGELTTFPTKKEFQKWGPLLGIFTGARLNEIAQLTPADVRQVDGVWCLDINTNSEGKHLKTASAKRIVPVHSGLIAQDFLKYVEQVKNAGHSRILHELTYDPANGYGRNLGRWFNESFLSKLGIKDSQLVFHSLRHTMITELLRAGVADGFVKAIVGHAQEGVTKTVYFEKGYKPSQLKDAIEQVHNNLTCITAIIEPSTTAQT
ncbi:MAG TPA: site-specific integrase [Humidesulfovibrio sp.]|uniref:site-specific integrase n=1 Tax=Humidesulfovibrio sp. TaxID=2910988 RepID=UPI002B9832F7|nr:site-specific integrase [Humidesulfovibrio sp.]HWR03040.1 site-specific integrase [Humidesulfovibrio sp.]